MTPHMKLDEKAVVVSLAWLADHIRELKRTPNRFADDIYGLEQIYDLLSAAHAPQGGVRGEPPAAVVDALNRHFATIGVTTKMPSVLAYDVWNIIRAALTGSDPQ